MPDKMRIHRTVTGPRSPFKRFARHRFVATLPVPRSRCERAGELCRPLRQPVTVREREALVDKPRDWAQARPRE